jgi:hypothetical protein
VLWNALPEHNPTKLDLTQNSTPTEKGDFSKKLTTHNAISITIARIKVLKR